MRIQEQNNVFFNHLKLRSFRLAFKISKSKNESRTLVSTLQPYGKKRDQICLSSCNSFSTEGINYFKCVSKTTNLHEIFLSVCMGVHWCHIVKEKHVYLLLKTPYFLIPFRTPTKNWILFLLKELKKLGIEKSVTFNRNCFEFTFIFFRDINNSNSAISVSCWKMVRD